MEGAVKCGRKYEEIFLIHSFVYGSSLAEVEEEEIYSLRSGKNRIVAFQEVKQFKFD
jgi:hypothetical protein